MDGRRRQAARGEVLIANPYHPYAIEFIDRYARLHGLSAVCVYTDEAEMRRQAWRYPELQGPQVSASYLIDDEALEAFADVLRERHAIVAVVPFNEVVLSLSGRIAELLGLDWAQPGILERFRDKHALKAHLRSLHDGPRINAIAEVHTVDDVHAAVATGLFPRFVLKPNGGFGNSHIGFFDADGDPAALATYFGEMGETDLREMNGAQLLMEEYIGGEEYFVNGFVDADGAVTPTYVAVHRRAALNGRENVAIGSRAIRTHEPEFDMLVDYTRAVLAATGLRRSPFHLEVKIDEDGPCLIEVAARLVGGERVYDDDESHGTLDEIAVAARLYLSADPVGDIGTDWTTYDATVRGRVSGTSTEYGRIARLTGVDEVERWPGFVRWAQRPLIGARLVPTRTIFELPWSAVIEADTVEEFASLSERMRATIRWDAHPSLVPRAVGAARAQLPRVRRKLGMLRHRAQVVPLRDGVASVRIR